MRIWSELLMDKSTAICLMIALPTVYYALTMAGQGDVALFVAEEDGKAGFINSEGQMIIDAEYDKAYPFTDGLAAVQKGQKWGFIDAEGEVVIEPRYSQVGMFSEGLAMFAEEIWSDKGYINRKGEVVIEPAYQTAEDFNNGIARVGIQEGGLTPEERKMAMNPPVPQELINDFAKRSMLPTQYHYIDRNGVKLEKPDLEVPVKPGELAQFKEGDKWGYKNSEGKVVIEPKFAGALPFHDGLAAAHNGEAYGYINKRGDFVIQPQFEYANEFSDGLAGVKSKDQGWSFIDNTGKAIIPPKYNWVYGGFEHGIVQVALDGKAIYINKQGEKIWPKD